MAEDRSILREIAWRDLLPWLLLFRTFRLSISLPFLFLATLATTLTPGGWWLSEMLFLKEEDRILGFEQRYVEPNRTWASQRIPSFSPGSVAESRDLGRELLAPLVYFRPRQPRPANVPRAGRLTTIPAGAEQPLVRGFMASLFFEFTRPFRALFYEDLSFRQFAYFLFGGLWSLAVWGFFAGTMTRLAVVRLGREERLGLKAAALHTGKKFISYFGAPLFPLVGVLLIVAFCVPVGLLMQVDLGVAVAGCLWFLVLLGGVVMAVILLGLLFGWPLMWPAIGAEKQGDVFEAVQRSYSYTFERPLHYLFYAVVTTFIGSLGWLFVYYFGEAVIWTSHWATSWGMGSRRAAEVASYVAGGHADQPMAWGVTMLRFWAGAVRTVVAAAAYSYFWVAASAIYLLLRQNVDETEFDEVFLENDDHTFEMPTLKDDPSGVPTVRSAEQESDSDRSEAS